MNTTTKTKHEALPEVELSALDRCDKCGSQAYYRVRLSNMGTLYFCRHDYMKNELALVPIMSDVLDESWKINSNTKSSENK